MAAPPMIFPAAAPILRRRGANVRLEGFIESATRVEAVSEISENGSVGITRSGTSMINAHRSNVLLDGHICIVRYEMDVTPLA